MLEKIKSRVFEVCVTTGAIVAMSAPKAFAAGVNQVTLVSTDFDNMMATITGNLPVLLPVGLTIMGVFVGVSMIPRLVYKFF